MKNSIIAIALMFCLSGCHTVAKTLYGIKKPRLEDENNIRNYLLHYSLEAKEVYVFKDLISFAQASEKDMINFPEALFFNRAGYLVRYKKETVDCNAKVADFIADLQHFSELAADQSVKVTNLTSLLDTSNRQPVLDADINVFITWTIYSGKLNKEKAFEWIKLLEHAKSKGVSVNYYLVNCDYQKSWNIPKPLQKKLGIKG